MDKIPTDLEPWTGLALTEQQLQWDIFSDYWGFR